MTMKCTESTRLSSESQERPLTKVEQLKLKFHTTVCPPCKHFDKQMKLIRIFSEKYAEK